MLEVYAAGEEPIVGADSKSLCRSLRQRGKEPRYIASPDELFSELANVLQGDDLVLTRRWQYGSASKANSSNQLDINKLKQ